MSAAKTGTPTRLNASASTCSVTVLPVPGRAGDEPVPVGHLRQQGLGGGVLRDQQAFGASATVRSFPRGDRPEDYTHRHRRRP